MSQFMQYKVVTASYETDLCSKVQALIDAGWELQGGVSITFDGGMGIGYTYAQAMIKNAEGMRRC